MTIRGSRVSEAKERGTIWNLRALDSQVEASHSRKALDEEEGALSLKANLPRTSPYLLGDIES